MVMLDALVKRVLLVSAVMLFAEALLPDSASGRFAKGVVELMGLSLIVMQIEDMLL